MAQHENLDISTPLSPRIIQMVYNETTWRGVYCFLTQCTQHRADSTLTPAELEAFNFMTTMPRRLPCVYDEIWGYLQRQMRRESYCKTCQLCPGSGKHYCQIHLSDCLALLYKDEEWCDCTSGDTEPCLDCRCELCGSHEDPHVCEGGYD